MKTMKKEKWYNKKISLKYIFICFILSIIASIFSPRPELYCSKTDDICYYYSVNFQGKRSIQNTFKISEIDTYEIIDHSGKSSFSPFSPILYLKNGEEIDLDFRTYSFTRADNIVLNILSLDNYQIKSSYWKNTFRGY